jgi:hypothetical protein
MCIPSVVAKQRLGKNLIAATNTHATTEEFLTRRFYAVHVVSKESRRLVLPRTSSYDSFSCLFNDAVSVETIQRQIQHD